MLRPTKSGLAGKQEQGASSAIFPVITFNRAYFSWKSRRPIPKNQILQPS